MTLYTKSEQLIGNTPMLECKNLEKKYNLKGKLFAKLEGFNLTGSVKDRVAKSMIDTAQANGLLKPGGTIIEPTSGNTGIGLAAIASCRGYNAIIVMPETMSVERQNLIRSYGAQVVLTPGEQGMQGAVDKANALEKEIDNAWVAGQFINPANAQAHYQTTGPEIEADLNGNVDMFIAGVGTGGTISGVGKYLKEKNNTVIIAVEPDASPLLSEGKAGPHAIQGIGANFIPEILDQTIYDSIQRITNQEAIETAKQMAILEGVGVGISSGAALAAGIKEAQKEENAGKNIVILCPDNASRYYSTALFQ